MYILIKYIYMKQYTHEGPTCTTIMIYVSMFLDRDAYNRKRFYREKLLFKSCNSTLEISNLETICYIILVTI